MADFSREYLEEQGIYQLRLIGKKIGVKLPTTYKKAELIEQIMSITSGATKPQYSTTKRGRPSKNFSQENLDRVPLSEYNYFSEELKSVGTFEFNSPILSVEDKLYVKGLVDVNGGTAVIVPLVLQQEICFIPLDLFNASKLEVGDLVECEASDTLNNSPRIAQKIISINGYSIINNQSERIDASRTKNFITASGIESTNYVVPLSMQNYVERVTMQALLPIKEGDCVAVSGDSDTTLLLGIYNMLKTIISFKNSKVVMVILNANKEYIRYFSEMTDVMLIATKFGDNKALQERYFDLSVEYTKHMLSLGHNVVYILQNVRSCASISQTMIDKLKNFFNQAKCSNVGTLTVFYGLEYSFKYANEFINASNVVCDLLSWYDCYNLKYHCNLLSSKSNSISYLNKPDELMFAIKKFLKEGNYVDRHAKMEYYMSVSKDMKEFINNLTNNKESY